MQENPFDRFAREMAGEQARASTLAVGDRNPDSEAEIQKRARAAGIEYEAARENEDMLRQREQNVDWNRAAKDAPRTTRFMADTSKAAIAHDDVGTLGKIEQGFKGFLFSIAQGIDDVFQDEGPGPTGLAKSAGRAWERNEITPETIGRAGAAGSAGVAEMITGLGEFAARTVGADAMADTAQDARQAWKERAANARPQATTVFGRGFLSGIESLPATGAALAGGLATGSAKLGASALGALVGGQSYGEGVDEGLSHTRATIYGIVDGSIEVGTELLPMKWLLGDLNKGSGFAKTLFRQALAEVPGEQAATLGQDFNRWASIDSANGKSFNDFVAEIPEHALQTFIATLTLASASTTLAYSADKGLGLHERRARRASEAQRARDTLADVTALAEASRLRERDPETFRQLLTEMSEDGEVEDVYVSPDKAEELLFQSAIPEGGEQEGESEPLDPNTLDEFRLRIGEAREQGTDVRVPLADFMAKLAGTPHGEAMLDHLKVDPNGMTKAEAEEFMATRGEELQREVEAAILRRQDGPEGWQDEVDAVRGGVFAQLESAGRFASRVNERYADLYGAFYSTMAARTGMSPREMFDRFPIRVRSGVDTNTENEYEQGDEEAGRNDARGARGVDAGRADGSDGGGVAWRGLARHAGRFEKTREHIRRAARAERPAFVRGDPVSRSGEGQRGPYLARFEPSETFSEDFEGEAVAFNETSSEDFHDAIVSFKDSPVEERAAVYAYSAEEYAGMRVFLSDDGQTGFAVKSDGDVVSLFSGVAGRSAAMLELAIEQGGTKLDAFDIGGFLPSLYAAHGFVETERMAWDDNEAPDGWPSEALGRPDVVYMALDRESMAGDQSPGDAYLYQTEGPIYYSALEKAVEESTQAKADGKQWIATLSKMPGVKKEEIAWTELPEWLEAQDGPVTREELLAFIKAGGVQVEEVTLGGDRSGELESLTQDFYNESLDTAFENAWDYYLRDEVAAQIDYPAIEEREIEDEDGNVVDSKFMVGEAEFDDYMSAERFADEWHDGQILEAESEAREDFANSSDLWTEAEERAREFLEGDSRAVKFAEWKEDGGEDYTELLLTLPKGVGGNPEQAPSTHWSEPFVVAHTRFDTRRGPNGEKIMFVEEVQSDWHQKGRDEGYAQPASQEEQDRLGQAARDAEAEERLAARAYARLAIAQAEELRAAGKSDTNADVFLMQARDIVESDFARPVDVRSQAAAALTRAIGASGNATANQERAAEIETAISAFEKARLKRVEADRDYQMSLGSGIPDAPFKSTWPALVMKRIVRYAADHGFDQVAWTTGEQQAERYDLAEHVGEINVRPSTENGEYVVDLATNAAANTIADQGHGRLERDGLHMTTDKVVEVFGKDLGGRMIQAADNHRDAMMEANAAWQEARGRYDDALLDDLNSENDQTAEMAEAGREYNEADQAWREAKESAFVTLDGDDLKIGGDGMKAFYDRNLANITNKVLKPLGGKVKPLVVWDFREVDQDARRAYESRKAELESQLKAAREASQGAWRYEKPEDAREKLEEAIAKIERELDGNTAADWPDGIQPEWSAKKDEERRALLARAKEANVDEMIEAGERAQALASELAKHIGTPEPSKPTNLGFDVTDEMKQKAREGFALFQRHRGAYAPGTDTITLFENTDLSTFLHESGHFFLEVLSRIASEPGAPKQIADDFDAALKYMGVESADAWRKMTLEQKREGHEKFARSFEAYLFTGRAPSLSLRDLFRTFRGWLVSVYKKAKAINASPSPQVRQVMDRLLATDEQIVEANAARSLEPMFASAEEAGMSADQWREYQRLGKAGEERAREELGARTLRDLAWFEKAKGREVAKLKRRAAAVRKETRAEVEAEVMAEPVYRALDFFKHGRLDGEPVGEDETHKLSIESVDALLEAREDGDDAKRALGYGQYGVLAKEGLDVETMAELFGFTGGDHLLTALAEAEPVKERIDGLTEQRLLEEHGDVVDEESFERAAGEAVANEFRSRAVSAELNALATAAGKPKLLAAAARQFAADTVARTRIRDLRPAMYEAAARRAGNAAMDQLKKGNRLAAAGEKRNQLFNIYADKAARNAQDEVDKALAYFKRILKDATAKSIDPSYREQIVALLANYDLAPSASLKAIDRRTSLAEWIERQREMGLDPVVDEALADAANRTHYKNLKVEELRGLADAVRNIEHLGRLKSKLLTAKRDREFAEAVDTAAETIHANAVASRPDEVERSGWLAGVKDGVLDFLALHRKFSSLIRQMDGFADGGPLWEIFVRPLNEAGDRETTLRGEASAALYRILEPMRRAKPTKKLYIPALGTSLSLEARVAVALNMGNATNRQRLMDGDKWDEAQLTAIAETLTAEQWQMVQQVWDHIDSYWSEIAAKERRVTGIVPEKVEAEPLRVPTADGTTVDLAGGYYPIKYDPNRSSRSESDTLAEATRNALRGTYARASTRRGHTKARVETVERPMRKDLGVLTQHITEVIHDLTHHEYLIDAQRLMRAAPIDAAIREHYGPETIRSWRKFFEDVAAGDVPAQDSFEKALAWLRTGATVAGMGWSITTAMLQPLGLAQSIVRVGPKWVGKGLKRWAGDAARFENTVAWITEQSPMMAERAATMQREINEIRNEISGSKSKARTLLDKSFFMLIAKFQLIADVPTWIGQYEKSVAAGEEHERAVHLADQAVLDAQGGGMTKDLAGIQRGGPMRKLWTNFYSYFSVTYNLQAESVGKARLKGGVATPMAAVDFLLLFVVPAVLQTLIFAAMRDDDKDEEELAKEAAENALLSVTASMVGVRDVASALSGDQRAQAPAGIVLNRFVRFGQQVQQGDADAAALKAANQVGGVVFHYPAAQVQRTVTGTIALAEDETDNLAAVAMGPPQQPF